MSKRIAAILLLLLFLLGMFLMAYGFLFSKENSTLGIIGIGFVLPTAYMSFLLRRQLDNDAAMEREQKEGKEPHYDPNAFADEDREEEEKDKD